MRGEDINFNPVFFSYALITLDKSILFINGEKLTDLAKAELEKDNVMIESYLNTFERIKEISCELKDILITGTCNWKLIESIGKDKIRSIPSGIMEPVIKSKSIKNETEIYFPIFIHR